MDGDQNGCDGGDCWLGEGRFINENGQGREISVIVKEESGGDGIGGFSSILWKPIVEEDEGMTAIVE